MTDILGNQYMLYGLIAAAGLLLFLIMFRASGRKTGDAAPRGDQYYIKGLNYLISNETDKAIEEFVRVTHLDPDTIESYLGLGHLYRQKGDFDRAIRLHRSLLARPDLKSQEREQILLALGSDYRSAGLWGRAVGVYRQVLEKNPNRLDVYQDLAAIHEEERNWKDAYRAQQEYEKRTGSKQKNILAHLLTEMGKHAIEEDQKDKAYKHFKSALSTDPACLDAALHLGDLLLQDGKSGKAIEIWEDVVTQDSAYAHLAYERLEKAYFDENRYDDIADLYRKVIESNPENVKARVALGAYFARKNMLDDALVQLREAIRLEPRSVDARTQISELLLRHHMHDEIEKEYADLVGALGGAAENFTCRRCGLQAGALSWRCPQCRGWDTFQVRS